MTYHAACKFTGRTLQFYYHFIFHFLEIPIMFFISTVKSIFNYYIAQVWHHLEEKYSI